MHVQKKIDWFAMFNSCFLALVALFCLIPMIHILAVSFSSSAVAATGTVTLWPKDFTLASYEFVAQRAAFWQSMFISFQRILLAALLISCSQ